MTIWNKAKQRQQARVYKTVKPIGDHLHENAHQSETCFITTPKCADYAACKGCGYLLCGCKPATTSMSLTQALDKANDAFNGPANYRLDPGVGPVIGTVIRNDGDGTVWVHSNGMGHQFEAEVALEPGQVVGFNPKTGKLRPMVVKQQLAPAHPIQIGDVDVTPKLMLDGEPLRVGDELEDRVPPKPQGLAARLFRVTELDGDTVDMVLLNKSDGSLWNPLPAPCCWTIHDVREELKRRVTGIGGSRDPGNG